MAAGEPHRARREIRLYWQVGLFDSAELHGLKALCALEVDEHVARQTLRLQQLVCPRYIDGYAGATRLVQQGVLWLALPRAVVSVLLVQPRGVGRLRRAFVAV